jgi:hypothetical protein
MKPSPIVGGVRVPPTVLFVSVTAAEAPEQIGSKATADWTESTEKAAATPEQKKVLASGKVATITGRARRGVVLSPTRQTWRSHAPCGSDCIKHGQPAGIVDENGKLTLLFVEEHDPRRNGEIDVRDKLASLVAKQVSATGMLTTTTDGRALYVHGADINTAK